MSKKFRAILIFIIAAVIYAVSNLPEADAPVKTEVNHASPVSSQGLLSVDFIDVGQGDSIFITTPGGKHMLIDAGESEYGTVVADFIRSSGTDTVDVLMGTHPHTDHIGGLSEIIQSFDTGSIYLPKATSTSRTYENLLLSISGKGKKITAAKRGVKIEVDPDVDIEILSPIDDKYSNLNNFSAVVKLVYGDTSFLFTGDAESMTEHDLLKSGTDISCDVLKVAHHGADTSSSSEFINAANPKIAVISVGNDNQYGHPTDETLKKLSACGAEIYRTDTDGNIRIVSDGQNVRREEYGTE